MIAFALLLALCVHVSPNQVREKALKAAEGVKSYSFEISMNRTLVVKGYRVSYISKAKGFVDRTTGNGYMNVTVESGGRMYRYNYSMVNWNVYVRGRRINLTMDVLKLVERVINSSKVKGLYENGPYYVLELEPEMKGVENAKAEVWVLRSNYVPVRLAVSYERNVPMIIRLGNLSGGVEMHQIVNYTVIIQRVCTPQR